MGITTVLWDLDGTLVGIRRRLFQTVMPVTAAVAFRDLLPPRVFLRDFRAILSQVRANASDETNYELMVRLLAEHARTDIATADAAMRRLADVGFPRLRRLFYPVPAAGAMVAQLDGAGIAQVVATNPLWPASTVSSRLAWGGFDPALFAYVSSGETMHSCKPRSEFYRELLERSDSRARDCVMIGNDVANDSPATQLGIPVFILGATGGWRAVPEWLSRQGAPCSSW